MMADGRNANAEETDVKLEGGGKSEDLDDEQRDKDIDNPYIGAIDYLEKNNIKDLFQVIIWVKSAGSWTVYNSLLTNGLS